MQDPNPRFCLVERILTSNLQTQISASGLDRRVTRNPQGGYYIWYPTPFSALKEGLIAVVKSIQEEMFISGVTKAVSQERSGASSSVVGAAFEEYEKGVIQGYTLIEPGCGDGRAALSANFVYGMNAVAIDIDPKMIEISGMNLSKLRRMGKTTNNNVEILHADVFNLDVTNQVLCPPNPRAGVILYLYLTSPDTKRLVTDYLPYLRKGDYILTNRVDLRGCLPKDIDTIEAKLRTILEPQRGSESHIYGYKVVK